MKVFLLKDVVQVGKAGQIVTASDGYVTNFILPRKLGIVVTEANLPAIQAKMKRVEKEKDEQLKQTSALSEKIAALKLTVAKKTKDGGKLYGAINAHDIMELLAAQGISVSKSQVEFPVTIKSKGSHQVRVKLSNKLLPEFTLRVIEAATE